MTGVVQPFPDDAFLSSLDPNSSFGTLRPLDFSNLLSYNDPPLAVSPAACPSIFSQPLDHEPQQLPQQASLSTNHLFDYFTPPVKTPSVPSDNRRQDAKLYQQLNVTTEPVSLDFDAPEVPPASLQNFFLNFGQDFPKPDKLPVAPIPHPAPQPLSPEQQSETNPPPQHVSNPDLGSYATSTRSSASDRTLEKPKCQPKKIMSAIEKAAERRRKNRESSSRCYYNRKRIIENLDKQISEEKRKLTSLYDRALELRHENARLKKDVVTHGIALPTNGSRTNQSHVNQNTAIQLQGYLQMLQSSSFQPTQ